LKKVAQHESDVEKGVTLEEAKKK